jgi:hypothetical protein
MSSGNDYLKEFFLQERRKGSLSLMVMERESGPVRQPASASTSPAGCRPAVFGSLRLPSGQAIGMQEAAPKPGFRETPDWTVFSGPGCVGAPV